MKLTVKLAAVSDEVKTDVPVVRLRFTRQLRRILWHTHTHTQTHTHIHTHTHTHTSFSEPLSNICFGETFNFTCYVSHTLLLPGETIKNIRQDEVWGCETKGAFHSCIRPVHISTYLSLEVNISVTASKNPAAEHEHEYLDWNKVEFRMYFIRIVYFLVFRFK